MQIVVADDYQAMSRMAADQIIAALALRPNSLIGPAAGVTPILTYALLRDAAQRAIIDFSRMRVVTLDELVLPKGDPATCDVYLRKHLLDPLGVSDDRYIGLDGDAADLHAECARMRADLARQGPIDLAILGLGLNGHLAWNEPGDSLAPSVHVADLAASTLQHAQFGDAQRRPDKGLTLGIGDILGARTVVLLVSGRRKAEQLRRLESRDISTRFPASLLWLHPNALCICDREAYSLCD